ncbi:hypothetical protein ACJX0J_039159, partial [Zea mays]
YPYQDTERKQKQNCILFFLHFEERSTSKVLVAIRQYQRFTRCNLRYDHYVIAIKITALVFWACAFLASPLFRIIWQNIDGYLDYVGELKPKANKETIEEQVGQHEKGVYMVHGVQECDHCSKNNIIDVTIQIKIHVSGTSASCPGDISSDDSSDDVKMMKPHQRRYPQAHVEDLNYLFTLFTIWNDDIGNDEHILFSLAIFIFGFWSLEAEVAFSTRTQKHIIIFESSVYLCEINFLFLKCFSLGRMHAIEVREGARATTDSGAGA